MFNNDSTFNKWINRITNGIEKVKIRDISELEIKKIYNDCINLFIDDTKFEEMNTS